jgi:hypothetical protein
MRFSTEPRKDGRASPKAGFGNGDEPRCTFRAPLQKHPHDRSDPPHCNSRALGSQIAKSFAPNDYQRHGGISEQSIGLGPTDHLSSDRHADARSQHHARRVGPKMVQPVFD